MKIPGWWRVRHFYNDVQTNFGETVVYPVRFWISKKKMMLKIHNKVILRGVNIIGYARKDFGISEHMRLVTKAVNTTEIAFCLNDEGEVNLHSENNEEVSAFIKTENPYRINLFCFNSDQTIRYMKSSEGLTALYKHYNIGYGYWELSMYPKEWLVQNEYLNEIWAPTRFIKEVIEKTTKLPVFHMPIPVDFILPEGYTRSSFKLPENVFLFLFTFDMSSFVNRKNPQAVIQAFIQAFPIERKDEVCLVIKVNRIRSIEEQTRNFKRLVEQVAFDSRIVLIDELLDRSAILGLIQVCDAYVSLHRSEGFGLGMAEAMRMGKAVIGTDYSGNTDFMNETNSCPVKYTLIPVNKSEYCFVEDGAEWADPDSEHAAYYMRKVYEDKAFYSSIGKAAKTYIEEHHNLKVIGAHYQKRIKELL